MDDVTAKVLAERWEADAGGVQYPSKVGAVDFLGWASFMPLETSDQATASARARIASVAPEALRFLLEAEWSGAFTQGDSGCIYCGADAPVETSDAGIWGGVHATDCRWLALMVKAGLR